MNRSRRPLSEVALLFTRLGFTAFGGPAAHVALMEEEVVVRRGWIDRRHFLDLVSSLNLVPGPTSTELAINLGFIRAGIPGLFVAGFCFILPPVLIILPLAWAYVHYGSLPQVQGIFAAVNAAVVSVVLAACWRLGRGAVTDAFSAAVCATAVAGEILLRHNHASEPELTVLCAAGIAGMLWYGRADASKLMSVLPLMAASAGSPGGWPGVLRMALVFLKIGATLFGSGYVLVSYLQTAFVDQNHWLTNHELLDAVSVGQVTPGPVTTTATFIGFLLGHRFVGTTMGAIGGALIATAAVFLPAFAFVAVLGTILPRVRHNRLVRGALNAMNAAVVALILVVALELGRTALWPLTWLNLPIAIVTLAAIVIWNMNATWMVVGAAMLGALLAGPGAR